MHSFIEFQVGDRDTTAVSIRKEDIRAVERNSDGTAYIITNIPDKKGAVKEYYTKDSYAEVVLIMENT